MKNTISDFIVYVMFDIFVFKIPFEIYLKVESLFRVEILFLVSVTVFFFFFFLNHKKFLLADVL